MGLKGEPQVKSSTRHTEIHTGKGRTSYKPQLENSKYIWYQTSRSTYITCTGKSWEDHFQSMKVRQEKYHFFSNLSAHKNSRYKNVTSYKSALKHKSLATFILADSSNQEVKYYHCFALSLSQIGSQPRDQERVHTLPLRLLRGEGINEGGSKQHQDNGDAQQGRGF